ncbi:hypothetical protein [Achromobacter kerstersii]|nr:hypothetical protein [Achromobacter kerstersii]
MSARTFIPHFIPHFTPHFIPHSGVITPLSLSLATSPVTLARGRLPAS